MLAFLYRIAIFLCVLFFLDGRARIVEEQGGKYWNDPICLLAFYTIIFSYVMFLGDFSLFIYLSLLMRVLHVFEIRWKFW